MITTKSLSSVLPKLQSSYKILFENLQNLKSVQNPRDYEVRRIQELQNELQDLDICISWLEVKYNLHSLSFA